MASIAPPETSSSTDEWVVVWFPPDGDRERHFADENKARRFAAKEEIKEWNPLLDHRITTTIVVSELVPLDD